MHGLNWQDYGARWLDNVRMQWTSVDSHAEKYYDWSPYAYCRNNPICRIDPDGQTDWWAIGTGTIAAVGGSSTKLEGFGIYAYNLDNRNRKKALSVTPLKRDLKALILELNDSDAALVDLRWKKLTISR